DLQTQINNLNQELIQKEQQIKISEKDKNDLQTQINNLNQELQELQEKNTQIINQSQTYNNELQTKIDILIQEKEQLLKNLNEIKKNSSNNETSSPYNIQQAIDNFVNSTTNQF
ncbi:MAG: hypothetical protein ACLTFB_02455, partial [Candidatus Phytoplasma pyri]